MHARLNCRFREVSLSARCVGSAIMRALLLFATLVGCTGYSITSTYRAAPKRHGGLVACAVDEARIHAEADAFFDKIDDDQNGLISFIELSDHLNGLGYTPGGVDHIFDLLDVNRDGEISRAELRASFVRYDDPALRSALGLGDRSTSEAEAIFVAIDANGDGQISKEELSNYLSSNGYEAEVAESVFGALDDNGDGMISRDELAEGYERYSALRGVLGLPAGSS